VDRFDATFSSVANLVASGCRASLQLVDHSSSLQDQAYHLCRHIVFSCMMYNDISHYSSSIIHDPPAMTVYGTVSMNRSFPYSIVDRSKNGTTTMEQLNDDQLLDQCRSQCLRESNKALDLLSTQFDPTSPATRLLRSMIQQIQEGLRSKTVI
jgi:hypothetical protein